MPKYNIKESEFSKVGVNYLNKDFDSLKNDLINYAKSYFPNTYNDFNETSAGMMLMEMSAYVGDVLSFYIDEQFKETLLSTSEERRNIVNIAKTFGYKPKPVTPSIVKLKFKQTVGDDGTSDINRVPQYSDLMTFDKGLRIQSLSNTDVTFETLEVLDFSVTGSVDSDLIPNGTDVNGLTNLWESSREILAVSGKTKEITFNIGSPQKFLKLSLPEKNVISIESVVDSSQNTWYQVDYLAQDKVYTRTIRDNPYDSSNNIPVQYTLDSPISVDKRFTVDVNENNVTSLIFGNGLIRGKNDTSFVQEVYEDNKDINALVQGTLPTDLDPKTSIQNESLGESPSNTVLTVRYRVGGGLESNVQSNDVQNVSNASEKQISGGNRLSTLTCNNENPARGGNDSESVDVIRERAKSAYASQNRAVTREDYESRILSMPAEFGNISKVFVNRRASGELSSVFGDLDIDSSGTVDGGDVDFLDTIIASGSAGTTLTDNQTEALTSIRTFLNNATNFTNTDLLSFKNLNAYVLSYDQNKYLVKTPDIVKQNLKNYLSQYKIISDDIEVKDGVVINFGVKFRIEARENVNKADLKLKCIDVIKNYFNQDTMLYNQVINTNDLSNVLYNIEGIKVIHELKLTQDADELNLSNHLYAHSGDGTGVTIDGQPIDGVSGPLVDSYGFGYLSEFNNFYNNTYLKGEGVILPPNANETPGVFELKNPYDNIKGTVE